MDSQTAELLRQENADARAALWEPRGTTNGAPKRPRAIQSEKGAQTVTA